MNAAELTSSARAHANEAMATLVRTPVASAPISVPVWSMLPKYLPYVLRAVQRRPVQAALVGAGIAALYIVRSRRNAELARRIPRPLYP